MLSHVVSSNLPRYANTMRTLSFFRLSTFSYGLHIRCTLIAHNFSLLFLNLIEKDCRTNVVNLGKGFKGLPAAQMKRRIV